MALLTVQNLTLSFGERTLFSDVSFDVKEGEKVGFVGANGVGKTTLFKVITGELQPDEGGVFTGKNVRVGYMEQHTCSAENTVWDELVSGFSDLIAMEQELHDISLALQNGSGDTARLIERQAFLNDRFVQDGGLTYKSRTRSTLIGLGFTEAEFQKSTKKLSGGQRSKLILAKLLLSDASLLLLDEPTNHLDIDSVEWLESFLLDYKGGVILISHDRYFLDKVTTKTIELENRKLRCFTGNYSVFLQKKEAEQKAIREKYENDMKEIERLEGIIRQQHQWNRERNIRTAESKEKVIERIKSQLVVPDSALQKIRFHFSPKLVSGDDVLFTEDLKKSFGEKQVFQNVTFDIKKGERVFLLGANGCGKTTLFKLLMGDLQPDSGRMKFGANVQTGYFDQVQEKLNLQNTALEEVWSAFPAMPEAQVRSALAAFLFKGDEVFKPLRQCSGGERARVALLKLMLGGYNFLLLDEPTNHLDAASREELENTLLDYSGTMFIVSHDRYFINKLATRILLLRPDGIFSFVGNYDDFLAYSRSMQASGAAQPVKAEKAAPKVNDYKLKKERASKMRKLETALKKLQEEIEQTEERIANLNELIGGDLDYETLMEKTSELDQLSGYLDILYEKWEAADSELTLLTD
mgnify:CR=1 FL=1